MKSPEVSFLSRFQIPKMRTNNKHQTPSSIRIRLQSSIDGRMGASSSKDQSTPTVQANSDRTKDKEVVCEHCVKSKQVDRPELDSSVCGEEYARVDSCMKSHKGQVSACVAEWKAFQQCHMQRRKTAAAVSGN
jgi:hypothetical protein